MIARRGSAAVEFAIALPVLLALLAGVIEFGWYFHKEVGVVQIARDAALAGSLTPLTEDAAGAAQSRAWAALAEAGYDLPHANVESETVAVETGVALRVRVSAPYQHLLRLVPAPETINAETTFRLLDQP